MTYLVVALDSEGFVLDLDLLEAHLREVLDDNEHDCDECPRELLVVTGHYAEHVQTHERGPSSWDPLEVWVGHDNLDSEDLRDILTRLEQVLTIARALHRAET